MNKSSFAVIQLDFPINLADRVLEELTMRRPTLDDEIKYVPSSRDARKQVEEEARYFAHLCGLAVEEIRMLDMQDYDKLQVQYLSFRGRATPEAGFTSGGSSSLASGQDAA